MSERGFDHIVVGGGTSGCVLASRLSEDPAIRVLMIEAGGHDGSPIMAIPRAIFRVAFDPRYGWNYLTEPQPELGGRRLPLIQARVLGGGSSINGMVCSRGAASDYDAWRDVTGCTGWGYEDVLPYFRRSEASERGEGPYHGGDGPVRVVRGRSALPIIDRVLEATGQCGYQRIDDLNLPDPDGFGFYDWAIANGRRASASRAFPGIQGGRPNLTVWTDAHVRRVVIEAGRAIAVEIGRAGGAIERVAADRAITLCAGGINTPRLLLLSGVGPADELRALGIPVVLDRSDVGRKLQNHTTYGMQFRIREPISGYRYLNPFSGLRELARYAFARSGFLAEGASPAGGFFRSDPSLAIPDTQLFISPLLFGTRTGPLGLLPEEHGFSMGFNQGTPESRGTITLRSADPMEAPAIDPRYFSEPRDLEMLIDATERMREVAAAPALAGIISEEIAPGPAARDRAAIAERIRAGAGNHYHVMGAARMGSDADSVTDTELRVRGIDGLRIADLSAAPLLVNGNTNMTAMMMAERAAEWLRAA